MQTAAANNGRVQALLADESCDTDIIKFDQMLSEGTENLEQKVQSLKPKKVRVGEVCRKIITDIMKP